MYTVYNCTRNAWNLLEVAAQKEGRAKVRPEEGAKKI